MIVALACAAPAAAQSVDDSIGAGYLRLYGGDREGAFAYFERLHHADPSGLAAWFGLLLTADARAEFDDGIKPFLEQSIDAFLDAAAARYDRSHADAEALFYLAQGHLLRSKFRFDEDRGIFGAARDAARAKGFADSYLKQHPEHGDAYLALGMYNYYVDIAPTFIKVLRALLFLPAGDRSEGLRQLQRAANDGHLFAPLAQVVLADIYSSLEGRLREGIGIYESLVHRFPDNPDMRMELAEHYMDPIVERYDRAAEQYATVIDRSTGSSLEQLHARYRATLGMASLRRNQWRLEEATAILTPVINLQPKEPAWVMPTFLLRRANYRALLNDAGAAADAKRVLADVKAAKFKKPAQRQLAFIEARRKTDEAAVYTALLPGNALVIEHRWDEAAAAYDTVAAAVPDNWQVRYRRAALEFARGNYAAAGRGFSEIAATTASVPAWLKAAALLNLGYTQDLAGRRGDAIKSYKRVVDEYENEASAGPARIGLISPYRRG